MHRIRHLREKRAWTQQHLADAAGLSRKTIVRLEKGELIPAKETLLAVAAAFNVELADLQDPQREWDELKEARDELAERFTKHHESLESFRADLRETRANAPLAKVEVGELDGSTHIEERPYLDFHVVDDPYESLSNRRLRFRDEVTGRHFTLALSALRDLPENVKSWFKTPESRKVLCQMLVYDLDDTFFDIVKPYTGLKEIHSDENFKVFCMEA